MKNAAETETQLKSLYRDSMQIPPAPAVFHLSLDLGDKLELCNLDLHLGQAEGVGEVQARGCSFPGPRSLVLAQITLCYLG